MRYILSDGRVVQGDAPIEIDEAQHLRGVAGMAPDERTALGITEVVEQPQPTGDFIFINEDPNVPGGWVVTPFPDERIKAELIAVAASARYAKETSGMVFNGIPIATDDGRSQLKITQSYLAALADPNWSTVWSEGGFAIDAPTMIAISKAFSEHTNNCFLTFDVVKKQIEAGALTTKEAVRAAFD